MTVPTMKQLEALYWTAKLGSFQAAAKELFTTQSAIAKRIGDLEDLFNIQLFERHSRGIVLTEAGQRMLHHAEHVLQASTELICAMSDRETAASLVRIGTLEIFSLTWLPTLVLHLHQQHPHMKIDIEVDAGGSLLEKLKQGSLDIAFVPARMAGEGFTDNCIGTDEFAWLASPSLGVPNRPLTITELAQYPRVEHSSHGVVTAVMGEQMLYNSDSRGIVSANTFSVLVQMTLLGYGLSYLPISYLKEEIATGQLIKLQVQEVAQQLDFFAVHRAQSTHRIVPHLITKAREVFNLNRNTTNTFIADRFGINHPAESLLAA